MTPIPQSRTDTRTGTDADAGRRPTPSTGHGHGERGRIAGVRHRIENQFLRTGGTLETLSLGFTALEDPLATLTEMHGQAWTAIETRLSDLDAKCDALETAFRAYAERIGAMVETAASLSPVVAQVSRTVRTMKIVALNARVAASTIAAGDDGLEVFTTTAGQLIGVADETTGAIREQIARIAIDTRRTFDEAFARVWAELSRARAAVSTVHGVVAGMAAPVAGGQDFGQSLQATVQDLKVRLGAAATAMQSGDRVRQRLEHIELLHDGRATEDGAWLQALAAELLTGAIDDFGAEVRGIEEILGAILQASRRLAAGGDAAPGALAESDVERTLGAVHEIRASLAVLLQVRGVFGDLTASLSADFERFDEALRGITEIEAQMHIVGVNAVITCSRLGPEGAALKEVANQLAALSAEVARHFAEVSDRIRLVDGHFRALSGDLSARPRVLIDEMGATSSELLDRLTAVFGKWDRLRREMGAVQAQLDDRTPRDLRAIVELAATLRAMGGTPHLARPTPLGPPSDAALATAFALYSMDAERDIHRAFCHRLGLADPTGSVSAAAATAANDAPAQALDDIFF